MAADRVEPRSEADRRAPALAIDPGHPSNGHPRSTPPGPVVVRRPSGKRPYVIDVIDVIGVPAGDMADPKRTRSIVLVNGLDAEARPRREAIQRTFDLTPRETDLAQQLCTGATLHEAAQALQISELHARQRLKVLMAKTGTSRQAELLTLLARLA